MVRLVPLEDLGLLAIDEKKWNDSSTETIGTSPLSDADIKLNRPFIDASSIKIDFSSFFSKLFTIGSTQAMLHDGVLPEPM